ncbi:MAG: PAS domain-containing protein [Planctomycetota bacterium]
MAAARRQLAFLEANAKGAELGQPFRLLRDGAANKDGRYLKNFRQRFEVAAAPSMLLDPGPGLRIVDVNDAYAQVTMTKVADLRGNLLFDVFPDNPDDPLADGVSNLYASFGVAVQTTRAHAMAIQRYDIRDRQGHFVQRYWRPINTPIYDDAGNLIALLHSVDDVTGEIQKAMTFDTKIRLDGSRRT